MGCESQKIWSPTDEREDLVKILSSAQVSGAEVILRQVSVAARNLVSLLGIRT